MAEGNVVFAAIIMSLVFYLRLKQKHRASRRMRMLQRKRARRMRMRRARVALEQRRIAFTQQWTALELQRQAAIRLVTYLELWVLSLPFT